MTVDNDNWWFWAEKRKRKEIMVLLWQLDRMFLTLTIFMMWACMSFYACIQPYAEKQKRKEILFLKLTRTMNIFWDFNLWQNELWTISAINGHIKLYIHKKIKLQMHYPTKFKSWITKLSTYTMQWCYKNQKINPVSLQSPGL